MPEEYTPQFPNVVDNSMMVTFRACPRKWFYQYALGLRPRGSKIDLVAGAAFAAACEHVRRGVYERKLSMEDALQAALPHFMREWGDTETPSHSPKTFNRMWEAVQLYFKHHNPLTDVVQPIFVNDKCSAEWTISLELPFKHPITNEPIIYGGRFDLLGKYKDEAMVIVDEKTTKQFGDSWARQWSVRSQFMGYSWAMQQSGYNVNMVMVRGIGIMKTDIRFQTAMTTFNQSTIDRWYEATLRDLDRMLNYWEQHHADTFHRGYHAAYGDACTSYGMCPFSTPCTSNDPTRWLSEYEQQFWNPLAKMPIADNNPSP